MGLDSTNLSWNQQIIQYFTKRLGSDSGELSVSEVMERIEDGNLHWSSDILRVINP